MYVDALGIWDDGSNRSPVLPSNTRATMSLIRSASTFVRLTVKRNDGTLLDFRDSNPAVTLKLYVRRNARDGGYVLQSTGTVVATEGPGRALFTITSDQTKLIQPGRYLYDVWLTYDGTKNALIPLSTFILQPGLSQPA